MTESKVFRSQSLPFVFEAFHRSGRLVEASRLKPCRGSILPRLVGKQLRVQHGSVQISSLLLRKITLSKSTAKRHWNFAAFAALPAQSVMFFHCKRSTMHSYATVFQKVQMQRTRGVFLRCFCHLLSNFTFRFVFHYAEAWERCDCGDGLSG